jgi:putative sporulation protein YyaC
MNTYVFNSQKRDNSKEISKTLNLIYNTDKPVIICIGSDLVVGDSLGPIVGTKLVEKLGGNAYVYGTLQSPITAKEIDVIKNTVNKIHPFSKILVIDAAVGLNEEIGYVKISNTGIKPGLGANKNLPVIGDVSIIGIVSDKTGSGLNLTTRFSLIYAIVNDVVNGIVKTFKQ